MKDKKWLIWGLIGFTAILLATAVVLFFQLKQPGPAPTPRPKPAASPKTPPVQETTTEEVCSLSFTVSPSPSPSASPSPSPSASPQPTACFDTCDSDAQCEEDLRCTSVSGTKRCVNPSCTEDADCSCASPNPSPSAPASPNPSASPQANLPKASPPALPQAGVNTPMVLGVSVGILMMLVGLLAL